VTSGDEVGALARSFNEMAARLEELEQARERQLAAIAHELARPLTGMRAAMETLRDGADADADLEMRAALLDGVNDELGRLQRLIEALQRAQKRTLRRLKIEPRAIALDRVIGATLAHYETLAAQSHITLTSQLPRPPLRVYADEDRLIQVLTNLLDNAFKFTPRGGRIHISAGGDSKAVWVTVADTGVGIPADELPHLFQEFYQGSQAHPAEGEGMGLGLAICREIVTAHGGTIRAESASGAGARFTFTLPKR
jgi:signal transduction histidine kinase